MHFLLVFITAAILTKYGYAEKPESNTYTTAYQIAREEAMGEPHNSNKLLSLAFYLKKLHRYREAIALYEHARPLGCSHASIERGLSAAYLALGDFEHGWASYEYRWTNPPDYNHELKDYLARGGSLQNKIVVLKTEYGLGDTLQFIRYAKHIKDLGARVVLESQKSLIPILSLCPYINEIHAQGTIIPGHFFSLLMSLPLILETKTTSIPAQIPYLYADKELIYFWKQRVNTKTFNIGICWQADPHTNTNNMTVVQDAQEKSIPLKHLVRIASIKGVQLYSLQKINGLEQLSDCAQQIIHIEDLDTAHGPFMDTAALMYNLDLVITVDTAIAHLAGGLGVPCWLLLNASPDWRWMLTENTSPWYPTMKLFRQQQLGEWTSVIDHILNDLNLIVPSTKRSAEQ
jgi:hypothetical protein